MTNLFCNVLVKFGEGAVEAEQGAIRELAWKKSHATQQKLTITCSMQYDRFLVHALKVVPVMVEA